MWTAIVAMFAAVIGFFGVVVGAVVTGFVTLRQTELASQRERQAQQDAREQARTDAHDAFQQENILALQEAVEDLRHVVVRDVGRKMAAADEGNPVTYVDPLGLVDQGWLQAHARVEKLEARIFDPDLKALIGELLDATISPFSTLNVDQAGEEMEAVSTWARKIHTRVGVLLPNLF
jgi:hypothetical protein